MYDHVTIIPSDSLVAVNGESLNFSFTAPANIHAIQWHKGGGHIEYVNGSKPNTTILGSAAYAAHVAPLTVLWKAEKARLDEEASRPPSLEEARAAKIVQIDTETSAAILAGFGHKIDGQTLHFSYDTNDQQNFADTANASTLAKIGVPGLPSSVTWNGWKLEKDGQGESARSLVRLTLTPDAFLGLYIGGALVHKAVQMEIGGQRKALAETATTLAELEAI